MVARMLGESSSLFLWVSHLREASGCSLNLLSLVDIGISGGRLRPGDTDPTNGGVEESAKNRRNSGDCESHGFCVLDSKVHPYASR